MPALESLLAGEVTDEHIDALLSMLRGDTARELHANHPDADALRQFMDEVRAALTRKTDEAWPQPNRHGVYSESDAETLAYTGSKADRVRAAVHVLQIGPDRWVSSYESRHLQGTSAASASPLTAQQTFEDRASALEEALLNVVTSQIQVNRDGNATPAQKRSADKVIEWCRQQRRILHQETIERLDPKRVPPKAGAAARTGAGPQPWEQSRARYVGEGYSFDKTDRALSARAWRWCNWRDSLQADNSSST